MNPGRLLLEGGVLLAGGTQDLSLSLRTLGGEVAWRRQRQEHKQLATTKK